MAIWIRQSGLEIDLADTDNLNQFAKDNNWTKKEVKARILKPVKEDNVTSEMAKDAVVKVKRTRRAKAQTAADNGNGKSNS